MKTLIAIILITIFCPHYYTVETIAEPLPDYTGSAFIIEYDGEYHEFIADDHVSGPVVLVMDPGETESCTDDVIVAIIEK